MGLSREQALQLYGTEAATGWGEAEAAANFKRVPEGGGYSSSNFSIPTFDPNSIPVSQPTLVQSTISVDDYINAIADTLPEPPEEYMKANPFWFDEQSATELATAEFSPYYDELLQDYLGEVKLTSEKNKGDALRTLADLDKQKELFFKDNTQDFDKLIRGIKEGYSSKGLYFGGTNVRDQVEAQNDNTNQLEGYMNTYGAKTGQVQSDVNFKNTQLDTLANQKSRDINREKYTSILGGVNQQKDEALDEYIYGMKTYYKTPNYKSQLNSEIGDTLQQQGVNY
jgi:hypothetical protein